MKKYIFLFIMAVSSNGYAMDVRPSKGVLGVPWNSSEVEAKKILGQPNGSFKATKYKKLVFYGKSVVLIFVRGKLKGFRYYDTCCRVLYGMSVTVNSKYNNEPISINGKELSGKSFKEINKELPQELGKPDYQVEIATDEAMIKLGFSGRGYPNQANEFSFSSLEVDYVL